MTDIRKYRRFFAEYVVGHSGSSDKNLIESFSRISREKYLGRGPWDVLTLSGYVRTPDDNPLLIYNDSVVAIDKSRSINSGQPTLHALCLSHLSLKKGETVVHIGAGTGYYSAIIGDMVGSRGKVYAFEIDGILAERARHNLSNMPWIELLPISGTNNKLPRADAIYVNAGATQPDLEWLNAVSGTGRLLFPLQPTNGRGGMLFLEATKEWHVWKAKFLSPAIFIPCVGAQDEKQNTHLSESFKKGSLGEVRSLRLNSQPDETAWYEGVGWWLSTKPAEGS